MKTNKRQFYNILPAVVLLSLCLPVGLQAKPLGLHGSWKGYFQDSDNETTVDGFVQFRQMYNASWAPLITRQMTLNADMGYSHNWFKDSGTREIISPSMQFGVTNDLFNFGLNASLVQNNISYRQDTQNYSWNTDLTSAWNNYLWPKLSLRMGQRIEEKTRYVSRPAVDTTYSYAGASVSWEAYKFKLFYDYNNSRQDEDTTGSSTQQDVEGHLAKLEYFDNFWGNRVSLNFSQLFYDNKLEYFSGGTNSLVQLPISRAYAGMDITPSFGALPLNQALIDGNKTSTAITIQMQQPVNISLQTSFNRVDSLYVYTARDDKLLVADTSAVTWDLYTSRDGVSWQIAGTNLPSSFNTTDFRFEVATGMVRAEYMKLVVTGWVPTLDVNVTEMEAHAVPSTDTSGNYVQDTRNYKTELYLGVRPLENTRFNYTFSWDKTENSGTNETESEQLIQTARLNWDYSRYLAPSAGFSSIINTNNSRGAIDTESRSYDLQIHSTPISTVDLSLTYSWTEYYEDEERNRTNNNIQFTALTALYPDLSAETTVGYNQTQRDITGEESDGFFINFIIRSQLRKTLSVDLQTHYYFSNSDNIVYTGEHTGHGANFFENTSADGGETSLVTSWRPSDILSFGLRGYTMYGGNTDTRYGGYFNANYLAFRTSKTNLTFNYSLNTANDLDTLNTFGLVWGWNISNHFTLNTSGNYILSETENSWNFYSQLSTKF